MIERARSDDDPAEQPEALDAEPLEAAGAGPSDPDDLPEGDETAAAGAPADEGAVPAAPRGTEHLPLGARIEALLFASGQALTIARLARALGVEGEAVKAALAELSAAWGAREGAIDLVEIAGGWRLMTRPVFHEDVAELRSKPGPERFSPAALETLAVVAYRQPITRADVEAVRGVQVGPVLRVLLDRGLLRITGRSSEPGHPLLYGTTKRFLDHFGLKSLRALPDIKELLESS